MRIMRVMVSWALLARPALGNTRQGTTILMELLMVTSCLLTQVGSSRWSACAERGWRRCAAPGLAPCGPCAPCSVTWPAAWQAARPHGVE